MLVFILDHDQNPVARRQTESSVRTVFPDSQTVLADSGFAAKLNRVIAASSDPFFLTLHAGERLAHGFRAVLENRLCDLPEDSAGIWIHPDESLTEAFRTISSVPRGPVVWRKQAATGTAGGFASRDELPFENYVLLEMAYRLSPVWRWREIRGSWISDHPYRPEWKKTEDEWACIRPILTAKATQVPNPYDPFITVVICSFNNAEYLLWSIRSVLIQSFTAWELMVIDDGSIDDTQEKLLNAAFDGRMILIRNDRNRGKAYCLNQALSLAKGKWLLELDADDWLTPDCLEVFAEQTSDPDPAGALYANHYEWLERTNKQLVFRRTVPSLPAFSSERLLASAVPLAPRCYHVETMKELGGWWTSDPFEGRLYEDFQMLVRVSLRRPVRHVQQTLYHRRIRNESVTRLNQGNYERWKSWFEAVLSCGQGT